jgi:hypothetical protein
MGDSNIERNHNVALMGDVVTISQKNEEETEGTVRSAADETTHHNHDEVKAPQQFKETVSPISQKNEGKTEGNLCSAADETTHPSHDDVKEPKSLSAAGLKSKTEHKEQDDADFCFLQSLVPDLKKLSDRKKLKFKELIISSIRRLLEED